MNATGRLKATEQRSGATTVSRLDRDFVTRLAADRGWQNVDEIAAGLGINRATYFRMLRGDFKPLLDTARSMASRADVTVDDLFPAA